MKVIKIHSKDNVWVALTDIEKGEIIEYQGQMILMKDRIPAKHKLFIKELSKGEDIIMYGVVVGKAQYPVSIGNVMTTDNTKHATEPYSYSPYTYRWQPPDIHKFNNRTFMGYHRSDGRVGTANYWLFIPTVFCENRNLNVIKEAMVNELGYGVTDVYKDYTKAIINSYIKQEDIETVDLGLSSIPEKRRLFKNIDGIKFLTHEGGCGGIRQDANILGKLLAAYADHPNVAGITILSLGCENLQAEILKDEIFKRNPRFSKPLLMFEQQKVGNEQKLIQSCIKETFKELVKANRIEREPAPLNKLVLGVKCGGSDGFSGISANPAVGYTSDLLVALGGTVLLAEFPELCGAEQQLLDRTIYESSAEKFIGLMESYGRAAEEAGSGFHMNPSPGNIKDGLITDAIKSNGAAKKGGTSPVVDVLDYTEPYTQPGLNLVCTPGNDVEATTGKTASGATLILFTTGLGTPTGNPICPTIKVSTNNQLAERMEDIIDINTGPIIEGQKSIEIMGEEILEFCIEVASGKIIPKAVLLNQDDFIPWKRGVSL